MHSRINASQKKYSLRLPKLHYNTPNEQKDTSTQSLDKTEIDILSSAFWFKILIYAVLFVIVAISLMSLYYLGINNEIMTNWMFSVNDRFSRFIKRSISDDDDKNPPSSDDKNISNEKEEKEKKKKKKKKEKKENTRCQIPPLDSAHQIPTGGPRPNFFYSTTIYNPDDPLLSSCLDVSSEK
jgi:hypothetical protein